MDQTTPLDIKVIYSADKKRRPVSAPLSLRTSPDERKGDRSEPVVGARANAPLLLASFNLLLTIGFTYFTWWPVDRFITVDVFMLQVPVVEIDMDAAAAQIFGIVPEPDLISDVAPSAATPEQPPARFEGQTAAAVIGAAGLGWLTLATIGNCILALACGAGLGSRASSFLRRSCFALTVLSVMLLAGVCYAVWTKYGRAYPPDYHRAWMGALVLMFVFWGVARGRSAGSLFRTGAVAMLLSAVGAVVGLYLWSQCGVRVGLEAIGVIGYAFVAVQWVYGVALWPTARRFA